VHVGDSWRWLVGFHPLVHGIGTTIPRIGSVSSEMDLEILFCGGELVRSINLAPSAADATYAVRCLIGMGLGRSMSWVMGFTSQGCFCIFLILICCVYSYFYFLQFF
jgi:hypothetical protein